MSAPNRADILDPIAEALMEVIYDKDDPVKVVGRWALDKMWDTIAPLAARQDEPSPALRSAAQEVMDLLAKYGPSIVPHLLDTDENPGQRLRDLLAANPPQTREAEGAAPWEAAAAAGKAFDFPALWPDFVAYNDEATRQNSGFTKDQMIGAHAMLLWLGDGRTPEAQRDAEPPALAKIIREVDGNHDLGAGELAERIVAHPDFAGQSDAGNRGIDPERLAAAILRHEHVHSNEQPGLRIRFRPDHMAFVLGSGCASAIAAEYARLAATQPPVAGTEGTE